VFEADLGLASWLQKIGDLALFYHAEIVEPEQSERMLGFRRTKPLRDNQQIGHFRAKLFFFASLAALRATWVSFTASLCNPTVIQISARAPPREAES